MSTLSATRPSVSATDISAVDAIKEKAKRLSIHSMMATTAAGSGHPTSCMSAAELMAGVFFHAMKFDPRNANSNENDRRRLRLAPVRAEQASRPFQHLASPLRDLVRVHIEKLSQFGQRLVALHGSQCHLRLEARRVVPAGSLRHLCS